MRDIQIIDDGNAFNFRVSGAVIKENKIMLNRLKMDDFWTFVAVKVSRRIESKRRPRNE